MIIFGDVFLRNFYNVFDDTNSQVGFAPHIYSTASITAGSQPSTYLSSTSSSSGGGGTDLTVVLLYAAAGVVGIAAVVILILYVIPMQQRRQLSHALMRDDKGQVFIVKVQQMKI